VSSAITYGRGRRGSIYVMTLSAAALVTVIGLSSLWVVRVQRRAGRLASDCAHARNYANSAIELGMVWMRFHSDWRTYFPNGTWIPTEPIGGGSMKLEATDPTDGDIANSPHDPVTLIGTGIHGQACQKAQLTLVPNTRPLRVLNTCLHASGPVFVAGGKWITVLGAPLSTNDMLDNDGTVDGDVEAAFVSGSSGVTGSVTVPAPAKQMPDAEIIETYMSRATTIPYTGTIDKRVISPGSNPWGPVNADGLYYIHTAGNDLTIKNTRINGTLVVRSWGKKLILDGAVFMHPHRPDYPALIVEGNCEIKIRSAEYALSESGCGTNFNPAGSPYEGVSDDDQSDAYPNEIRGLVHVVGFLRLRETARVRGTVICDGPVSCGDRNQIIHDPNLYSDPPMGYSTVGGVKISPGSWKRLVD